MTHRFAELAFTPAVRAIQESMGSRKAYAKAEGGPLHHDRLGDAERDFIATRDSLSGDRQRDGLALHPASRRPASALSGFSMRRHWALPISAATGNISRGAILRVIHRVALFFMDYRRQARLKLLGVARPVAIEDDPGLAAKLAIPGYSAKIERGFLISVEAFDWNCSQHITPRFTAAEVAAIVAPLQQRIH